MNASTIFQDKTNVVALNVRYDLSPCTLRVAVGFLAYLCGDVGEFEVGFRAGNYVTLHWRAPPKLDQYRPWSSSLERESPNLSSRARSELIDPRCSSRYSAAREGKNKDQSRCGHLELLHSSRLWKLRSSDCRERNHVYACAPHRRWVKVGWGPLKSLKTKGRPFQARQVKTPLADHLSAHQALKVCRLTTLHWKSCLILPTPQWVQRRTTRPLSQPKSRILGSDYSTSSDLATTLS